MKKVMNPTLLLVVILFFSFCATMELERGLPSDIKQWYEKHSLIMNGKVPACVNESEPSECQYFLQLPERIQREYIDLFWKIRPQGSSECFYSRISFANQAFRGEGTNGWKTDRGRIFILFGEPTSIRWFRYGQECFTPIHVAQKGDICVWYYFASGIGESIFTFRSRADSSWRLEEQHINATLHNQHIKKLYGPIEDDWDLWARKLLRYVKKEELNEKPQNVILQ